MPEEELVQKARNGDGEAFADLIRRYERKVYGLAYSLTRDRASADDLAQEIFVKAYFSLPKFKGHSAFGTWLYRISSNHLKDYLRKKKSAREVSLDAAVERTLAAKETGEEIRLELRREETVRRCLETLPAKHQMILGLRDIQGLSYEEIAGILKVSLGTVDSRLFRARKRLKEKVESFLEEEGRLV